MSQYQGPTQPHAPIKVVEPGTPEHDAWKALQTAKQKAAEKKFNQRACFRPAFWGGTRTGDDS